MKSKVFIAAVLFIVALTASVIILANIWSYTPYGRLDPKVAFVLKFLSRPGQNSFETGMSIHENRLNLEKMASLVSGAPIHLPLVENINLTGQAGPIPARMYAPDGNRHPIILFFHGGGWVRGSINSHDNICRILAKKTNALVISVDYRLAPEHTFPAAVDDAYTALLYIHQNAASFGGDASHIAVVGDSAGGNLAAVVAQMARDKRGPSIACQVLIYPVTNIADTNTESYRDFQEGYILTRSDMEEFISLYAPEREDRVNPYASPLLAGNFKNLPPALVITDQFDVLRDEGEAYANRLEAAGVPVKKKRYKGVVHGFVSCDRLLSQANNATDLISAALKEAFR